LRMDMADIQTMLSIEDSRNTHEAAIPIPTSHQQTDMSRATTAGQVETSMLV
jgi:hypothetical protein